MTIQPTRIIPPDVTGAPRQSGGGGGGQQGRSYVIYDEPPQANFRSRAQSVWNRIPDQAQRAQLPSQVPQFLRTTALNNRSIVFNAWIVAMIVVGVDEWHNLGILPRPARLWDTSLVYGILVLLGFADIMVPIANILAIGFTITLIWQYYNGGITPAAAPKAGNPASPSAAKPSSTPGITTPGNLQQFVNNALAPPGLEIGPQDTGSAPTQTGA